ncbi:hypothetical protein FACS1894142_7870 [Spirochaetia bacterium]|nr:hypothetical protein FACS1894142_7870 [Spirochaetia bacterium]
MLVIIGLVIFWYGLVPVGGAFIVRRTWRLFRRRFDDLRLKPLLDYGRYGTGGVYRFTGGFESVTDRHTLWIRSSTLTIPVALTGAQTYMLPMGESDRTDTSFDPGEEAPERVRWDRISSLTEGAKVFVGGPLVSIDDRWTFVSTKENPLLVIFYDGPDRDLTTRVIRAGRHRNEYWNPITPYSLILGAFSQIMMALAFLARPVFRLTVMSAFAALFVPLFPLIPPGMLFTQVYRRLWWRARIFRAYRDLIRLPLKYLSPGKTGAPETSGRLPDGERYGLVQYPELPARARELGIPLLIPEEQRSKEAGWCVFGALREGEELPLEPQDVFATYGAIPGNPEELAHRYTVKAYGLEIIAWLVLLLGIGLNAFFIGMIIFILG